MRRSGKQTRTGKLQSIHLNNTTTTNLKRLLYCSLMVKMLIDHKAKSLGVRPLSECLHLTHDILSERRQTLYLCMTVYFTLNSGLWGPDNAVFCFSVQVPGLRGPRVQADQGTAGGHRLPRGSPGVWLWPNLPHQVIQYRVGHGKTSTQNDRMNEQYKWCSLHLE